MTFLPKRTWVVQLLPEVTRSDTLFDSNRSAGGGLKGRDTPETREAASALTQHCLGQDKTEHKLHVTHRNTVYQGRHSFGYPPRKIFWPKHMREGLAECKCVKWPSTEIKGWL